jgi:hypothetical protein
VLDHDPGRASQRTGEVRNTGVDGDDEIEAGQQRGRLGEIGEVSGAVDDVGSFRTSWSAGLASFCRLTKVASRSSNGSSARSESDRLSSSR